MPDGSPPIYVFTVTATDAELIARSYEAIQRSCELLRDTQHLTDYLERRYDALALTDNADNEAER